MAEATQLAYEERGSGPVLLFVHGFPLDRTMWIDQLAGLAKIRRCVAVDLRGHGLSEDPNPGGYSMDLFADDLAATLDELGAEKADVCGLSMGGYVALAFWRRHPDRVRSLVLCCTKAEADSAEGKAGRDALAELVREKGTEALFEALLGKMFRKVPSEDVVARCRRMITSVPPEVATADLEAMRDRPDSVGTLSTISVPALWIAAEEDVIMPLDAARATAGKIPTGSFVEVPVAGHMAPMENPEAVNAALRDFLKDLK